MAQTYTGVNWLTQAISNKVAAHIIKRKVGGSVDVDLKTYSLTDLMAGKVKSATIKLEGAKMMDARLGTIEATTCQPVWYSYSKKKNKSRGVQTPVLISLKATLTQKDVTDALESTKIASTLRGLNLDLPGLGEQQLQIIKPAVEIKDSLVFIKAVLVTKGGSEDTGVPISISAKPILVNQSDIILSELKVESEYITKPEEFAKFFAELINPVVRFSRYDRKNRAFRLVTLDVKDGRIEGKGNLLLAPKQPPPSLAAKH